MQKAHAAKSFLHIDKQKNYSERIYDNDLLATGFG